MSNTIYEPSPGDYEAEYRGLYQPVPTAHTGVIMQGSVAIPEETLIGHEEDYLFKIYDVRLLIGPFWQHVDSVVPKVTIDGYKHTNPDEDDFLEWVVRNLTWDTIGGFGPGQSERRIRLKFEVVVRAPHAFILRFGYFAMASGRRLGDGGIGAPGPIKD